MIAVLNSRSASNCRTSFDIIQRRRPRKIAWVCWYVWLSYSVLFYMKGQKVYVTPGMYGSNSKVSACWGPWCLCLPCALRESCRDFLFAPGSCMSFRFFLCSDAACFHRCFWNFNHAAVLLVLQGVWVGKSWLVTKYTVRKVHGVNGQSTSESEELHQLQHRL